MAKIEGLRGVLKGLQQARQRHGAALDRGLVKAGLFLQRESQMIVPVDTGTLRLSAFTRKEIEGLQTVVIVGYTAEHAVYVHENLEARHGSDYNSWYGEEIAAGYKTTRGPDQQAKFLEQPARTKRAEMRNIILAEVHQA